MVLIVVKTNPVVTKEHRDIQGFLYGLSCLCPFGFYTRGELVLWDIGAIVELRRGDLFYFPDHLIYHSNRAATGVHHSVVAFTEHRAWNWMQERMGIAVDRDERFRNAYKNHAKGKEGSKPQNS
jgi:hypothetical protein